MIYKINSQKIDNMTNFLNKLLSKNLITAAEKISFLVTTVVTLIAFFEKLSWAVIIVLGLSAFALTHYVIKEVRLNNLKFPKMDKREDRIYNVLESYFNKKSIRIVDFLNQDQQPIIRNKIFENCIIYGPCIFANMGINTFDEVEFFTDGAVDSMLYPVASDRTLVGVIGIAGCTFRKCQFKGIGLMGTAEMLGVAKSNINHKQ